MGAGIVHHKESCTIMYYFVQGTLVNVVVEVEFEGISVTMKGEAMVVVGERMPS